MDRLLKTKNIMYVCRKIGKNYNVKQNRNHFLKTKMAKKKGLGRLALTCLCYHRHFQNSSANPSPKQNWFSGGEWKERKTD